MGPMGQNFFEILMLQGRYYNPLLCYVNTLLIKAAVWFQIDVLRGTIRSIFLLMLTATLLARRAALFFICQRVHVFEG